MVDVARIRADLLTARKTRDKVTEVALKRALALFDNAAAPPAQDTANIPGMANVQPTEVTRIELTPDDLDRLLRAEIAEAAAAAQQYEDGGQADAAGLLRAENAILAGYLASAPPA